MTNSLPIYPEIELIHVLNEDYASFGKMELVAKFDDLKLKLYTSPQLKETMIKIFKEEPQTTSIADKIEKYINNEIVIPCRYNKSLLKHLLFRTKVFFIDDLLGITNPTTFEKRSIGGFYDPRSNKIYLMIDNNVNLFNFTHNDKIAQLTVHEISHYLSKNNTKGYYSAFDNDIVLYYSVFYKKYFELDQKFNKEIVSIMQRVAEFAKNMELKNEWDKINTISDFNNLLDRYMKIIRELKPYSKLNDSTFDSYVDILQSYVFYTNVNTLYVAQNFHKYQYIYMTLLYAYVKGLNCPIKKIQNTFFYQEFLTPSEIICIESIKPNITKTIGRLM